MKLSYAATISALALLVTTALGGRLQDCPTIKTVLSRSVCQRQICPLHCAGRDRHQGSHQRLGDGKDAADQCATLYSVVLSTLIYLSIYEHPQIRLPEGVDYNSASVRPRSLGSSAVSGRTLK